MISPLTTTRAYRALSLVALAGLLVTVGFVVPPVPDASAQQDFTTKTVSVPGTDGSLALYSDGLGFIGSTSLDAVDGEVTGVRAARCNDAVCRTRDIVFRDRMGLGSTEVAIDANDVPMMAYVRQGAVEEIWLARCDTSACANPVSAKVTDGDGGVDLAIDSNGHAVIAFEAGGGLRLARCGDAACSNPTVSVVELVGQDPSLALSDADVPIMSYKGGERSTRQTIVSACADVTCSTTLTRTEIPRTKWGMATSIAIASDGLPVIAADDADQGMKLAFCDDPTCATLDVLGLGHVGADTAAMALDEFDNPVITWADGRLNMLKCTISFCSGENFVSFDNDALYDPFDSPPIAIDADGNPVMLYEATDNRVRMVSCDDSLCGASGLPTFGDYYVMNVDTGEYLDPQPDGSFAMSSERTKRTRFSVPKVREGIHVLSPLDFQTYMEADGAALSQSFGIQKDNRWRVRASDGDSHTIHSIDSGATMVVVGSDPVLQDNPGPAAQDQWRFIYADLFSLDPPFEGETVALQNVATGRWLDGDRNGPVNQSVNQRDDDTWEVSGFLDYAILRNGRHRRYLDADRGNDKVQMSISAGIDDRWDLVEVEPGIYTVRNVRFGGYLDADTSAPFDVTRTDTVSPSSLWRIVITE